MTTTQPSHILRLILLVVNFVIAYSNDSLVLPNSKERVPVQQQSALRSRDLIYGGQDAESGRYPYFVRLVGTGQCGGALIAPEVVVTAAHCKGFIEYAEIGRYDLKDREERFEIRQIERMIVHPEWDGRISYNDIMVVQLETPVDTPVIELNRDDNFPLESGAESELFVLGFGNTVADPLKVQVAAILQEIQTDYIPFESCSVASDLETGESYGDSQSGKTIVTDDWLCTLANDPRRGNCVGDAGGPVVKKGPNSFHQDILVGVVVSGSGCGNVYLPDQNQRISYHVDFIRSKTCNISQNPPEPFRCPGTPTPPPTPSPTVIESVFPSSLPSADHTRFPTSSALPTMLPTTSRPSNAVTSQPTTVPQIPSTAPSSLISTQNPAIEPSVSPVPPTARPNPAPSLNGLVAVEIKIEFDNHPESSGWLIADAAYEEFLHHLPFGAYPVGTTAAEEIVFLKPGRNYMFTMEDEFGDGMCCPSPGRYEVLYQGEILVSGGGAFGYFETTYFTIPRN